MNIIVIVTSVAAIAVAWYYNKHQNNKQKTTTVKTSNNNDDKKHRQQVEEQESVVSSSSSSSSSSSFIGPGVYVIGDLHGDSVCAQKWVERTGLIRYNNDNDNNKMEWVDNDSHLVFLGDYIDKGVTSKQTIEYVKSLTDTFPNHVTAILGNHEIELLRDRTSKIWGNGNAGYYQLAYSSVHPGEYINYIDNPTNDDYIAIEALYNASVEAYGRGLYRSTYTVPDTSIDGSLLHLIPDERLRNIVQERLHILQNAYIDTFRTGTELGTWLETRPIAAVVNNTLFVHGGLPYRIGKASNVIKTIDDINQLNELFYQNSNEDKFSEFIMNTQIGQIIYNLVVFRGNHKNNACTWLHDALPETVTRLAVGHTPGSNVRIACENDSFLAVDSSLSRWFRNSGNNYCPGDRETISSNGNYICNIKSNHCQGQIVRIYNDQVELLTM